MVFVAPVLLGVMIIVFTGAMILSLLALTSGLSEAVARSAQRRGAGSQVIKMPIDELFPGSVPMPSSREGDPAVTRTQGPGALDRDEPSQKSHAALQFFVGGAALFAFALILTTLLSSAYDGVVSLLVEGLIAVLVAVGSMAVAFTIGLPLRMVDALRFRWLANGELTVAGAVIGVTACFLLIGSAPVRYVADDFGGYAVREPNGWLLLAAWVLFAFSVAHFVWPRRWRRVWRRARAMDVTRTS